MPILDTPYASLDLIRQPEQPNEPLQAFDAADEYVLATLHEQRLPAATRVLILNDSFGALACALAAHVEVTSSGDSHLPISPCRKTWHATTCRPNACVSFPPARSPRARSTGC